jgi:Family of unknown function (DUF5519)
MSATPPLHPEAHVRSLPTRWGPPPRTTVGVPHQQLDGGMDPALHLELLRRLVALPGVALRPSAVSDESTGLVLADDLPLPDPRLATWRGRREFAQVHGDGSLHVILPPRRARQAIAAGWAERHPLAEAFGCDGLVLLFVPRSLSELDTVTRLVCDAYAWWTGVSVLV